MELSSVPPLAALYRGYLDHQRRFHTLVSVLRGPSAVSSVGGYTVESIIPISTGEMGNATVDFLALSYADRLTVTVIADPQHVPDLKRITQVLQRLLESSGDS